jgi:hypothetical protein
VKNSRVEIGRVNIRMQGGQWTPHEAETMARLMVQQVRDGLARQQGPRRNRREMERVAPAPVRVRPGTTSEEAARAAAAEICRALREG